MKAGLSDDSLKEKIILGVDPGTQILGYSVISGVKNTIKIRSCGIYRLNPKDDHFQRLANIYNYISAIVQQHKPTIMAIEAPFYGKNIQSMLKLGRAQGAAIIAGMQQGLDITEYSPRRVKQAITGNGNASKEQVAKMLQSLYGFHSASGQYDETDAVAVAVCHFFEGRQRPGEGSGFKDWKDYLEKNPKKKKP